MGLTFKGREKGEREDGGEGKRGKGRASPQIFWPKTALSVI